MKRIRTLFWLAQRRMVPSGIMPMHELSPCFLVPA